MTTHEQVHELIHRSWKTPDGMARILVAEQALAQAEALGEPDLEYSARVAATSAYHQGGEPSKAMMTFARCLADYDADPARRSSEDERLMLWQFKFMVSSMLSFPEVGLQQTKSVLDDMERRYRAGGHSLHAVYAYRHSVAAHLGDIATVDYWYRMWDTAARDRNSDCIGCDPSSKAGHHIRFGTDEDAITIAEGALSGRLTCAEQPQSILTKLLLPYVRTGRLEEARNAHRRAYRALSDNVANMSRIASHIEFCALTGNEMRGLELVERHLSWMDKPPSPRSEMDFAAAAALVLHRLVPSGVQVRRPGGTVSAAELAQTMRERATAIAARFDARNGNGFQGELVAARIQAQPLVEYLPLSVTAASQAKIQSLVRSEPAVTYDLTAAPVSFSVTDQLNLAETWAIELDPRADALTERIARQFDEASLSPLDQARLMRLRAAADRADPLASIVALEAAAGLFAGLGDRLRELTARGQLALVSIQDSGDPSLAPEGLAATEEALRLTSSPLIRTSLHVRAAYLHLVSDDTDAAMSSLELAEAEPVQLSVRRRAQILTLRAALTEQAGDVSGAIALMQQCIAMMRPLGKSDELARSLWTLASLLGRTGDHTATIAAFEEAAAAAISPELRRSARSNAGFMLVGTDRAGEFIDDIVEHICLMVAEGEDTPANFTRHRLAIALNTVGRHREAAEVAEEALSWFVEQEGPEHAQIVLELRDILALVYVDLGEPHAAIAQLRVLAELTAETGDHEIRAGILRRLAELLSHVDRDAEAAQQFDAAAQAYSFADLTLANLHCRRRAAMCLHYAGSHAEAVEAVKNLATLFTMTEAAPDEKRAYVWERANAHYDAAFILTNGDPADHYGALEHIVPAAALFRSLKATTEALLADLRQGAILVITGQLAVAEPLLRNVLKGLPSGHNALQDAAHWRARALDELGEHRKARKVRKEFGLPEN